MYSQKKCSPMLDVLTWSNHYWFAFFAGSNSYWCFSEQSTTRVKPFICTMPMRLDEGWNQIQFNLSDFTRRAYGMPRRHTANPNLCSFQNPIWGVHVILSRFVCLCIHNNSNSFMCILVLGTNYIETLRVQIHANCRIRRIYFSDRLYSEEELPPEFKLFLPIQKS